MGVFENTYNTNHLIDRNIKNCVKILETLAKISNNCLREKAANYRRIFQNKNDYNVPFDSFVNRCDLKKYLNLHRTKTASNEIFFNF